MPFVAEAARSIDAPPEVVFDRLADYGSWASWMPRSFRPIGRAAGALRVGDRLRVRIAGLPSVLEVTVVERAREIAWRGGVGALLSAEHRFLFAPEGATSTRVRSVEIWKGALSPFLRPVLRRGAERVGKQQLDGLARAFAT